MRYSLSDVTQKTIQRARISKPALKAGDENALSKSASSCFSIAGSTTCPDESALSANVMHLTGADLTVIGKHSEKLDVFRPLGNVLLHAEPESFEVVIEATGHPSGMEAAFRLVRKKGIIVLKSTFAAPVTLDLSQIPVNELTIVGSRCLAVFSVVCILLV